MFDFHMHSQVSFDATGKPEEMVKAAALAGLKEICFTDHIEYEVGASKQTMVFSTEQYNAAYDHLASSEVKIRRGIEFGLKPNNQEDLKRDLQRRHFDFVIGSVHMVKEQDVYFAPFWEGKTMREAYRAFLEETLACVQAHDEFDVLGHLTFICKSPKNPTREPILYNDWREVSDEILRTLAQKGKGLEVNTSGVDVCGEFLPSVDFFRRFKGLGGEVVTVGSDAHDPRRVGRYSREACEMLREIFGYVCTFEERKPIFHKIVR